MMRARLLLLAEQRARLAARAGVERESLAALAARTDGAVHLASGALTIAGRLVEKLRNQPLLAAAGVMLLIALRPRRALGWMVKGWSIWRSYRGALRWWQRFSAAGAARSGG